MEKKWLSVAGLWLALIALVFIYTDRNEYTWRYEGDELGQIVISSEEARRAADTGRRGDGAGTAGRAGAHGCQPLGNG